MRRMAHNIHSTQGVSIRKTIDPPTETQVNKSMEILLLTLRPFPSLNLTIDGPRKRLFNNHSLNLGELAEKEYSAATAKGKVGRMGIKAPRMPIPDNVSPKAINNIFFIGDDIYNINRIM